ncbi:MAG: oligosaccharide flippase family protein [Acidobacteriota bacterium]|nr:oligosaccharide flippase family protein [Acidobacteriota bacterium]
MNSPPGSLRHRAKRALVWSGAGNYGSGVLHLLALLGLGWLLPPTDFGLLALALIAITLEEGIGDLGLPAALIQRQEIDRTVLDSAFLCNLAVYLLLAAATFFYSDALTGLLGDSNAAPLLRLLCLSLIITGFSAVPRALLTRRLDFRRISMAQFAGEIGFAGAGLTLAALGFGALALGGAVLAQRLLICAVVWRSVDYRPGLSLDLRVLRHLVKFGAPVMASNVVERVLLRADYFVIGRFVGTEPLGYYSLALQLSLVPLQRLAGLVRVVAFPTFSIVQKDATRIKNGLLEGMRGLLTVVLPAVILVVVSGPWLLRALYGEKWEPSVEPLRILGLAGLFLLPRLLEAAFMAVGKPRLLLQFSLLRLIVFAALVWTVGIGYGISGVAACVVGALAVWAGAYLVVGIRLFAIPWASLGGALWPTTRSGVLALAPLLLLVFVSTATISPWMVLAYTGISVTAIYLALTLPRYWGQLRRWLSLATSARGS